MKKVFLKSRLLTMLTASFLLGLMLFSSCSNNSKIGSLIPDDASFVVSVDINSLWKKGDISNIDQLSIVKSFQKELKNEDPNSAKLLDEMLKDPNSCGLMLKGQVVAFKTTTCRSEVCIGLFVKKASTFEDFLKQTSKKFDFDIDISNKGDYQFAYSRNLRTAACWNKKKAYIIGGSESNAEEDAESLMSLTKQNSMAGNKEFNKAMKIKGDLHFFVNNEQIVQNLDRRTYREAEPFLNLFKNSVSCLSLNFKKGSIVIGFRTIGATGKQKILNGDVRLSLDLDDYPDIIEKELKEELGRDAEKIISELFKSVELKIKDDYSGEIIITLKDKSKNSLKVFIDLADTVSKRMLR